MAPLKQRNKLNTFFSSEELNLPQPLLASKPPSAWPQSDEKSPSSAKMFSERKISTQSALIVLASLTGDIAWLKMLPWKVLEMLTHPKVESGCNYFASHTRTHKGRVLINENLFISALFSSNIFHSEGCPCKLKICTFMLRSRAESDVSVSRLPGHNF